MPLFWECSSHNYNANFQTLDVVFNFVVVLLRSVRLLLSAPSRYRRSFKIRNLSSFFCVRAANSISLAISSQPCISVFFDLMSLISSSLFVSSLQFSDLFEPSHISIHPLNDPLTAWSRYITNRWSCNASSSFWARWSINCPNLPKIKDHHIWFTQLDVFKRNSAEMTIYNAEPFWRSSKFNSNKERRSSVHWE